MSPPTAPVPQPQLEDPRRAISPTANVRPNGIVQQAFGTNNKGKTPMRPRREDESTEGSVEAGTIDSISYSQHRDRGVSPDQVRQQVQRAKSPPSGTASRTVSPNGELYEPRQPPNMVGVSMGMNGVAVAGRGSPAISAVTGRTSPAVLASMERTSPVVSYPASQNGSSLALNGGSFPTRSGSGAGTGSVSSVAADLVKDLKAKDFELDGLKRQMSWMKEALLKAAKAGYVLSDRQGSPDLAIGGVSSLEGHDRAELLFKFKQFRVGVQVRRFPTRSNDTLMFFFARLSWLSKLSRLQNALPRLSVSKTVQRKKLHFTVPNSLPLKSTATLRYHG